MGRFEALEISLDVVRSLRQVMPAIRRRSGRLAKQVEDAASSVALNLGEGRRRFGKDRLHLYRVAAGSADEVRSGLHVAEGWGYVSADQVAESLDHIDHLLAILWTLTQGPARVRAH